MYRTGLAVSRLTAPSSLETRPARARDAPSPARARVSRAPPFYLARSLLRHPPGGNGREPADDGEHEPDPAQPVPRPDPSLFGVGQMTVQLRGSSHHLTVRRCSYARPAEDAADGISARRAPSSGP